MKKNIELRQISFSKHFQKTENQFLGGHAKNAINLVASILWNKQGVFALTVI